MDIEFFDKREGSVKLTRPYYADNYVCLTGDEVKAIQSFANEHYPPKQTTCQLPADDCCYAKCPDHGDRTLLPLIHLTKEQVDAMFYTYVNPGIKIGSAIYAALKNAGIEYDT